MKAFIDKLAKRITVFEINGIEYAEFFFDVFDEFKVWVSNSKTARADYTSLSEIGTVMLYSQLRVQ